MTFREWLNEEKEYKILKSEQVGDIAVVAFIHPTFGSIHIAAFYGKKTAVPTTSRVDFSMTGKLSKEDLEKSFERVVSKVKQGKEPHIATDL